MDSRYLVHTVRFGLSGRVGWLQVDRLANVTGRAPGLKAHMNVSAKVLLELKS